MGHHRILNTATTQNKSRQVDDFPGLEHTNRLTGPARETDSRLNGQFGHCAARFFTHFAWPFAWPSARPPKRPLRGPHHHPSPGPKPLAGFPNSKWIRAS